MEVIYTDPAPQEDPTKPLYAVMVNLAGNDGHEDEWVIEEQSQGIPREIAVTVLLHLAAGHLDSLCQYLGQSGRGPGLLNALADQIKHHYKFHHQHCAEAS